MVQFRRREIHRVRTIRTFSDERQRYLSRNLTVSKNWEEADNTPTPHQMELSLSLLLRSMEVCPSVITQNTLGAAHSVHVLAEIYCGRGTRLNAVISAAPCKYLAECRESLMEEVKKSTGERTDATKFQGRIRRARFISDLADIINDMIDKARM